MRCIAIDDELNALKVIELYVEKVEKLNMLASFTNPVEASVFLENNAVDLVFLDINMQGLNGFELLDSLTSKPFVIFTTAYGEYAAKSYSFDAIDYLVKPITFSRFLKAVNKADGFLQDDSAVETEATAYEDSILSLKSGTTIHRVELSNIKFLRAEGNYTKFFTDKGSILVLGSMKEALAKVGSEFIQTHRSYAVAISKVDKLTNYEIIIGNDSIPIGMSYRKKVLARFT